MKHRPTTAATAPKTLRSRAEALHEALAGLRTAGECQRFLEDLCTPAELEALADRWAVAALVDEGLPYREIHDRTGVSTATVTRVGRALTRGAGGYRLALDRRRSGARGGRGPR